LWVGEKVKTRKAARGVGGRPLLYSKHFYHGGALEKKEGNKWQRGWCKREDVQVVWGRAWRKIKELTCGCRINDIRKKISVTVLVAQKEDAVHGDLFPRHVGGGEKGREAEKSWSVDRDYQLGETNMSGL